MPDGGRNAAEGSSSVIQTTFEEMRRREADEFRERLALLSDPFDDVMQAIPDAILNAGGDPLTMQAVVDHIVNHPGLKPTVVEHLRGVHGGVVEKALESLSLSATTIHSKLCDVLDIDPKEVPTLAFLPPTELMNEPGDAKSAPPSKAD